jgi:predicted amidophosphoribosyltransferase
MQPIELALFGAVVALAAGLIGYLLWPFTRARRAATSKRRNVASRVVAAAEAPPPSLVCPACQREYDAGLQFCPQDARELVAAADAASRATAPGVTCPNCGRAFDATKRFCPFDGDELVPLPLALGSTAAVPTVGATGMGAIGAGGSPHGAADVATVGGVARASANTIMGKICPHCSRRYESDATFCGRDGASLVSVN